VFDGKTNAIDNKLFLRQAPTYSLSVIAEFQTSFILFDSQFLAKYPATKFSPAVI